MRPVYEATRSDEKAFLRDIKPDTRLYVTHTGGHRAYSEWVVIKARSFTGQPQVKSTDHGAVISAQSLLRSERAVHTQRPTL